MFAVFCGSFVVWIALLLLNESYFHGKMIDFLVRIGLVFILVYKNTKEKKKNLAFYIFKKYTRWT